MKIIKSTLATLVALTTVIAFPTMTALAAGQLDALTPARLADTRPGATTIDGQQAGTGLVKAGSTLKVTVAGRGGVPTDATSTILNVTAVLPTAAGHLTVYPCGTTPPNAANVNYTAGQVVPNAVLAKIGTNGQVCIRTHATTHIIVDINGYVAPQPAVVWQTFTRNAYPGFSRHNFSGTRSVLTKSDDGGAPLQVVDTTTLQVIAESDRGLGTEVRMSPDGTEVLSVSVEINPDTFPPEYTYSYHVWNIASNAVTTISPDDVCSFDYSSAWDGLDAMVVSRDDVSSGLPYACNLTSGTPIDVSSYSDATFSRNGRYMAASSPSRIRVFDLVSRTTITDVKTNSWFLEGEASVGVSEDGAVALRSNQARAWWDDADRAILPAGARDLASLQRLPKVKGYSGGISDDGSGYYLANVVSNFTIIEIVLLNPGGTQLVGSTPIQQPSDGYEACIDVLDFAGNSFSIRPWNCS